MLQYITFSFPFRPSVHSQRHFLTVNTVPDIIQLQSKIQVLLTV